MQVVGRQIDQLDVVGLVEYLVRQGLALPHAGRLVDEIVQALEVLDVDRRPDVDAGVEQLLDVLPALRVPRCRLAAGEIGVGELVHQENGGVPGERGVEVELLPHDAAVGRPAAAAGARGPLRAARSRRGRAARGSRSRRRFRTLWRHEPPPAWSRSCRRRRRRRRRSGAGRGAARASSALTWASSWSGSGRASAVRSSSAALFHGIEREVQLEHVDPGLAEHSEPAPLGVVRDQSADPVRAQVPEAARRGPPDSRPPRG